MSRSPLIFAALLAAGSAAAAPPIAPPGAGPLVADSAPAPIALEDATVEQLARFDGVGPALAERIIAYRSERGGRLGTVEELRAVEGMTPAALRQLRDHTGTTLSISVDGRSYGSVDEVLARFAGEPTIQQVQEWTQEYARTSPEMLQAWARASQSFALLPRLQVEYLLNDDLDRRFAYESVGGDLQTRPTSIDELQGFRVFVRSQWDLSELVMSSDRIRVINEAQDAVKLRDRLLGQVTRLYFDRRRQQVQLLLDPPPDLRDRVDAHLRLLELTAGIDALTGGRFSKALPPATR
jgi:competence ComEA-like helix-hairpin-helix protein